MGTTLTVAYTSATTCSSSTSRLARLPPARRHGPPADADQTMAQELADSARFAEAVGTTAAPRLTHVIGAGATKVRGHLRGGARARRPPAVCTDGSPISSTTAPWARCSGRRHGRGGCERLIELRSRAAARQHHGGRGVLHRAVAPHRERRAVPGRGAWSTPVMAARRRSPVANRRVPRHHAVHIEASCTSRHPAGVRCQTISVSRWPPACHDR